MERINKIRAWSPSEKKMYYPDDNNFVMCSDGSLLRMSHGRDITDEYYSTVDVDSDLDWIPMFFVGVYDKNGNEEFEGDIIKISPYNDTHLEVYGEVIFTEGRFLCKVSFKSGVTAFLSMKDKRFERVGNVYENPERLK